MVDPSHEDFLQMGLVPIAEPRETCINYGAL